jgi:hypothetical protein
MPFKARVLIPAGAVVAAILATACVPPPPPPPPPPPTTTPTTQPAAACPATPKTAAGPDSPNPISSWGVNGTAVTTVVIGDVVYVGGTFSQAVSPTGSTKPHANLAAFCLANGNLLDTFQADLSGKAQNASASTTEAWALTTDGTNLFVGGNFSAVNGTATGPLAKLNPVTGAVQSWNPGTIPDIVYALDYFGGQVYAGGDFSINANLRKGVRFDAATGTVDPSWNANTDAKIEALKVSPDGRWVYIGGAFQNVQGQPHDKLAKLQRSDATVQSVLYGASAGPGNVGARVFDIAVDVNNQDQVYVALGPKSGTNPPPQSGAGNRFIFFNASGAPVWNDTGPDGDGQAVELIGSVLYAGFHGGWNGDSTKRLEGLNASNGGLSGFAPTTGGVLGVFDLAQAPASGRFVAVGDFSFMGSTNKLNGVAIFG